MEGRPQGHSVGRDDLNVTGQVIRGETIEEAPTRQANVGKKIAVTDGFRRQRPLQVLTDHQPRHPDVTPEVLRSNLDETNFVAPDPSDQRT